MAYGSGYIVNFVDVIPAYASVVFGISTAVATVGALMGNVIAGLIIKQPTLQDWRQLFSLFGIIYFMGGLAFLFWGSAEPQTWAQPKAQEKQQTADVVVNEETIPMTSSGPVETAGTETHDEAPPANSD